MNGYLKIKTKIDNKEIDKGITEIENKIKKLQIDNENSRNEENLLQKEIDNYKKLQSNADNYKQKIKELNTQKELIFKNNPDLAVSVDTTEYAKINSQISEMQNKYARATSEIDKQSPKIDKITIKLNKIKAKQTENNMKISEFKQKIEQIKTDKVQNSLNNVGRNLQNQIGKLGRMALAVIGIRTAWNAVRGAISTVTQYNKQVSTDFEYMRYCIASMLAPVVQGLIKLLYTVLSYINAIASAWFGINLFGNASVKNFKKMQKSASGTAKSAKEIQKSLAGFDEMNILQDNKDKSSKGSSVATPSMDLSGIQGDIPDWLKWIIDNKDLILSIIAGIGAGIVALKLGFGGLKALGIGIAVAGIVKLIQDVIKFIKDPSFDNFLNILRDIAIIVAGIAIALGAWPVVIGAVIALIVVEIIKHWDQIKEILGKVGQWIYDNVLMPVCNFIKSVIETILNIITLVTTTIGGIFKALIGIVCSPFEALWKTVRDVFSGIKTILSGILTVFKRNIYWRYENCIKWI